MTIDVPAELVTRVRQMESAVGTLSSETASRAEKLAARAKLELQQVSGFTPAMLTAIQHAIVQASYRDDKHLAMARRNLAQAKRNLADAIVVRV